MQSLENRHTDTRSLARRLRVRCVKMTSEAKSSHLGGALSAADIVAVLYGQILRFNPADARDPRRDRVFYSKGHASSLIYAVLAECGFISEETLRTFARDGSALTTHVSHQVPGVELSTGSLGHALSVAVGGALAQRIRGESWRTFCILSDGELNEGSNWEAVMFAGHHKLGSVTTIIDENQIQSFGRTEEVLRMEPLKPKFEQFGWETVEVDGHDHEKLLRVLSRPIGERPLMVIAHTIKGKGVSFMENRLEWHYKSPTAEDVERALAEIFA